MIGVHGATFPARMEAPREALQPVCSVCRGPFVAEHGDTCPACLLRKRERQVTRDQAVLGV